MARYKQLDRFVTTSIMYCALLIICWVFEQACHGRPTPLLMSLTYDQATRIGGSSTAHLIILLQLISSRSNCRHLAGRDASCT